MNSDNMLNPSEQIVALEVSKRQLYNFRWFDLSQFNNVYSGVDVSTYSTGKYQNLISVKDSDKTIAA